MTISNEDLRTEVRKAYAAAATRQEGCCRSRCCGSSGASSMIGDAYDGVEGHVADADLGLGCGLPVEHAGLRQGDTVLDLGAGAGNDVFVARHEVGPTGFVIGVDMTPEMVTKARANTEKLGFGNVEFRLGEIEHLPVETKSVDVVVSNCVLNLVPDKRAAFVEMMRVLKPGGRFCISDVVSNVALPNWAQNADGFHSGCVGGAIPKGVYLDLLEEVGFRGVQIVVERRLTAFEDMPEELVSAAEAAEAKAVDLHVLSVTVVGSKPE